jgi:hypothetical protein
MVAPAGYGPDNFVSDTSQLPYEINFENAPIATAPAQRVDITDRLDPNLDWSTFHLTAVGFGSTYIIIPAGLQHYDTTVNVSENGQNFNVVISLNLNPATGVFTASLQSIDPSTDLPPENLLAGFLPPEDGGGHGMGFVSYIIDPKQKLATGTPIRNVALITFDGNQPIATDQINDEDPTQGIDPNKQALVTIDSGPPTSSVTALPATEPSSNFAVNWPGQDDAGGSGIASYDIYVSDNGDAFTPWLTGTTQTSATFNGANGHTYGFFSVATDNVGNQEATTAAAQAITTVHAPVATNTSLTSDHSTGSTYGQAFTFTATVSPASTISGVPTGAVQFQVDGIDLGSTISLVNGTASVTTSVLTADNHSITAFYTSSDTDNFSNSSTQKAWIQVVHPAPLVVTADNQSKVYGAALPTLAGTLTGVKNGDNITASYSTAATVASHVGTYAITALLNDLDGRLDNYTVTINTSTLSVTPASLTITADNKTMTYGGPLPALTASYSGFVNGDTSASLTAQPSLNTTATASSPGGSYPITVSGAADGDYTIGYVPGTLSVSLTPEQLRQLLEEATLEDIRALALGLAIDQHLPQVIGSSGPAHATDLIFAALGLFNDELALVNDLVLSLETLMLGLQPSRAESLASDIGRLVADMHASPLYTETVDTLAAL